ncbi:MAG TPA: hypothetical protein VK453_21045 [Micromonosporaceae bacterium]|nr:hypothetical protein [Micromonosporaceae bacterium]
MGEPVAGGSPAVAPDRKSRPVRRGIVSWLAIAFLVCGWPIPLFVDGLRTAPYKFSSNDTNYRLRLTNFRDVDCVALEEKNLDLSRNGGSLWSRNSDHDKECTWPRVEGGDGWLAGGRAVALTGRRDGVEGPTGDWVLFGVVPKPTAQVSITLANGTVFRIPTKPGVAGRIYLHYQPGLGEKAEIAAMELRDGAGEVIRVH